jgi:inhibitor of KinA sporulation pathway (predicted exonuclease)
MQYIVFDLEATCWEGNQIGRVQEIIEIGAFRLDTYGAVSDHFQKFVRPLVNPILSPYCRQLTGIDQKDIDLAKGFRHTGAAFLEWIQTVEDDFRLCSWGAKDKILLEQDCIAGGLETEWLDACIDLKAQYHHFKGLAKQRGFKKTMRLEGMEFDGSHHRALDDADNLVALFVRYLDMWVF